MIHVRMHTDPMRRTNRRRPARRSVTGRLPLLFAPGTRRTRNVPITFQRGFPLQQDMQPCLFSPRQHLSIAHSAPSPLAMASPLLWPLTHGAVHHPFRFWHVRRSAPRASLSAKQQRAFCSATNKFGGEQQRKKRHNKQELHSCVQYLFRSVICSFPRYCSGLYFVLIRYDIPVVFEHYRRTGTTNIPTGPWSDTTAAIDPLGDNRQLRTSNPVRQCP